MNIERIKRIAESTREDFDSGRVDYCSLSEEYEKYAKVPNISEFLKIAKSLFPRSNCGVASIYLKRLVEGGEIIEGKYGEDNHTFLFIHDIIVDITADQFNGPKIYVGPIILPWKLK